MRPLGKYRSDREHHQHAASQVAIAIEQTRKVAEVRYRLFAHHGKNVIDREAYREGARTRPDPLEVWPKQPHQVFVFSATSVQFFEQEFGLIGSKRYSVREGPPRRRWMDQEHRSQRVLVCMNGARSVCAAIGIAYR